MTASIIYTGNLRCESIHVQSNSIIETDAPTDNKGKGEKFSPTDLLTVSLATCILTTMGIKASEMGVDISSAKADVTKHMFSEPRRIGKIDIHIQLPSNQISEKEKTILERVGNACPVKNSLHPELLISTKYTWI